jgi:hypothetical protein
MFGLKERALIYVMAASVSATGATAITAVSETSASEQHSITYKAAQSLSNGKNSIIEEASLVESTGIDVSTLFDEYDDTDDELYVDGNTEDVELTLEDVTAILKDLEEVYPTGMVWTNDTYYKCKGKGYATGGFGCAAFAYMISDLLYGNADYHKSSDLNDLQPFDVVELYHGKHTVFVISVNDNDTVTVAEANVSNMVRWGAEYSVDDITGILKRY